MNLKSTLCRIMRFENVEIAQIEDRNAQEGYCNVLGIITQKIGE